VAGSCFYILSLSLCLFTVVPSGPFVIIFVWFPVGAALILSGDSLTSRLFLTVSPFKELVVLVFMQFICEHILSTLAEVCGKKVTLVMKDDNKANHSYPILNHYYAVKFENPQIFGRKIHKAIENPRSEAKTSGSSPLSTTFKSLAIVA